MDSFFDGDEVLQNLKRINHDPTTAKQRLTITSIAFLQQSFIDESPWIVVSVDAPRFVKYDRFNVRVSTLAFAHKDESAAWANLRQLDDLGPSITYFVVFNNLSLDELEDALRHSEDEAKRK